MTVSEAQDIRDAAYAAYLKALNLPDEEEITGSVGGRRKKNRALSEARAALDAAEAALVTAQRGAIRIRRGVPNN